jgi:hypothetical protein
MGTEEGRNMVAYNLMPGALTIDLVDGSIHGDLDHCPKEDLLESARALLSLLPQVRHKGLWALSKDYDASCYLYTTDRRYKAPEGLTLPVIGAARPDGGRYPARKFWLMPLNSIREEYWRGTTYNQLIGSVREGQVNEDITGVSSHYDAAQWERPVGDPRAKPMSRVAKPAPQRRGAKALQEKKAVVQCRFF